MNIVDPDQTAPKEQSDQDLQCLQFSKHFSKTFLKGQKLSLSISKAGSEWCIMLINIVTIAFKYMQFCGILIRRNKTSIFVIDRANSTS